MVNGFNSLSLLARIAGGECVTSLYKGEDRFWFDLVDENQIERAIAQDPFPGFVRLIQAI